VSSRVFLYGNGSYANRGCEAIVRGTAEVLRAALGPDTQFIVASTFASQSDFEAQAAAESDPGISHLKQNLAYPTRRTSALSRISDLARRYSRSDRGMNAAGVLQAARASSVALAAGGDNYSNPGKLPLRHIVLDRAVRSAGVPSVLWGASVGPYPLGLVGEAYMQRHLRGFDRIYARESLTFHYLQAHAQGARTVMTADPAFAMTPSPPSVARIGASLEDSPVGINLSPLFGRYVRPSPARRPDAEHWVHRCTEIVGHVAGLVDRPILLVPHVMTLGNDDFELLSRVADRCASTHGDAVRCAGPGLTAAELKWVIGHCSVFASARMHATIASVSQGIPTVWLAYSRKARGLAADVYGGSRYCIDPADLSPDGLGLLLSKALGNVDALREITGERAREFRAKAYQSGEDPAELLGVRGVGPQGDRRPS